MDNNLGNLVNTWALDHSWTAFLVMWALGIAAGGLIWGLSKRWPRVWRVLLASFGAAIFLAPNLAIGHQHGLAVLPGLLTLTGGQDWGLVFMFFGWTWLICAVVCTVVCIVASFMSKPLKA